MKKKNSKNTIGIVITILAVLSLFFFYSSSSSTVANGYWNEETKECWSSETQAPGVPYVSDGDDTITSCCFNLENRQVDCNNPDKPIGSNFLAIYGVGSESGTPGIFSIAHSVKVTNDGTVPIEKAWIDTATWSPSNSILSTAYARIVGSSSTYSEALPTGTSIDFPTQSISLQDIGGEPGLPKTYNLNMNVKATAYSGQLDSSKIVTGSITVEKEVIGFKVDIGWGA